MGRPNLFSFATSELSQDAFLCWLLAWADRSYEDSDDALHRTATNLLHKLLSLAGIEEPPAVNALKVRRQYKSLDILVLVNDDIALLVEDKTETSEHSDQLRKYLTAVRADYPTRRLAAVYLKTGDQCDFTEVKQSGFGCYLRRDLLELLRYGQGQGVDNDIFRDFTDYLEEVETAFCSFRTTLIGEWEGRRPWSGFFSAVRDRLGDGRWGYVSNPSGGFMAFWWHWKGNKYLQLEEKQLCFKLMEKDKSRQAEAWTDWQRRVLAAGKSFGIQLEKPTRRRNGTWMTVASYKGDYRTEQNGILDLDRTIALLKTAEEVLDAAVKV